MIFSSQLEPSEVEILTKVVATDAYQRLRAEESNYYLAAQLMEAIALPKRRVAYALVQASWETTNTDRAQRYRREALAMYNSALRMETRYPHTSDDHLPSLRRRDSLW